MGSTVYYKDTARIEQLIDSTLIIVLRILIIVFFGLVSALSLIFAVAVTCLCFCALGLRVALRLVSRQRETHRLFALAGC